MKFITIAIIAVALMLLTPLIIMLLWNGLISNLFELKTINFWQALLLTVFLAVIGSFFKSSK